MTNLSNGVWGPPFPDITRTSFTASAITVHVPPTSTNTNTNYTPNYGRNTLLVACTTDETSEPSLAGHTVVFDASLTFSLIVSNGDVTQTSRVWMIREDRLAAAGNPSGDIVSTFGTGTDHGGMLAVTTLNNVRLTDPIGDTFTSYLTTTGTYTSHTVSPPLRDSMILQFSSGGSNGNSHTVTGVGTEILDANHTSTRSVIVALDKASGTGDQTFSGDISGTQNRWATAVVVFNKYGAGS